MGRGRGGWGSCPAGAGAARGLLQRGRAWQRKERDAASAGDREPEPGFSLVAFQCSKRWSCQKSLKRASQESNTKGLWEVVSGREGMGP